MSDTQESVQESVAQNLNFGTFQWPYHATTVEVTRRAKDPTTGKAKAEKVQHPIVAPVITGAADAANYLSALVMAAEAKATGSGVKLFNVLLADRIQEASDNAFDSERDEHDENKIIAFTLATERARSHGLKLEDINKAISELVPELIQLGNHSAGDQWQALINPVTQQPLFESKDAYSLRLIAVQQEVQKLLAVKEQKEKKQAEIKSKRDAKVAKGKAAAAAIAPGIATGAEPNPIPEPAH